MPSQEQTPLSKPIPQSHNTERMRQKRKQIIKQRVTAKRQQKINNITEKRREKRKEAKPFDKEQIEIAKLSKSVEGIEVEVGTKITSIIDADCEYEEIMMEKEEIVQLKKKENFLLKKARKLRRYIMVSNRVCLLVCLLKM